MKTLTYGFVAIVMATAVSGITGCQALESAKNSVVASVAAMRLKADIEGECSKYESKSDGAGLKVYLLKQQSANPKPEGWDSSVESLIKEKLAKADALLAEKLKADIENSCAQYVDKNDGVGLKAYLTKLQNTNPKPDGWNSSLDDLLKSWMAKAATMLLKIEIQSKYDNFIAQGDAVGAKNYLNGLLAMDKKPTGWDDSVAALVNSLLAKVKEEVLKCQCEGIWKEVKAALEKKPEPDFVTARKLTSTAEPFADEELRSGILKYRIGILNEVINPYQCDWIIHRMKSNHDVSDVLIKDEFPGIEQKVKEIASGLKNLYWLDDKVDAYLAEHVAQARELLDARAVSGDYRDYKEVFDLVDAAVAEMKLYNPKWGSEEQGWEISMKNVRRVMTTAEANRVISKAKAVLMQSEKNGK